MKGQQKHRDLPMILLSVFSILLIQLGSIHLFRLYRNGSLQTERVAVRICILMVLLGTAILMGVLLFNQRRNRKYRETIRELNEQTAALQEASHRQRLELIGTMTSGIAHEFSNMLTPIMGYSLMSMEHVPEGDSNLMENLSEIYSASERAKQLISRLSSLSRKNDTNTYTHFSPDELLENIRTITKPSVPHGIKINILSGCAEECLFADKTQITQVLLNIFLNAFQAMEPDGGTLTASAEKRDGKVIFRISDTGSGITSDALVRIFEPFYTTKESGKGTGLGLPIAQHIMEAHGGKIYAESSVGTGTTFFVELPVSPD